ncbi:MAG: bifunctional demethylmenaquinone methyltransferase/2-methoxy-6-polyprenyl-1,4-benzoquinol methylase UbiE [Chitinophagaceae bacterium]|jgi:demethylmenaquinone methyltransferase/2-methoxy-6-polyprenyl-1,4-benzoquinol methylase|nr:bifunctional demethylmenaquinone methyltransferase/2-methoxy-6-polyprenyl-1,4-benzoquinol methylase UbiE [Chitinophagaceae bacterium]
MNTLKYEHDDIVPFETSGKPKKEQVAEMFNEIAHRYDFLNRFLSAGIDIGWRKKALSQLKGKQIDHMLDVATGTADVAIMAMETLKPAPARITGIDISDGMLDIGRKKLVSKSLNDRITLENGDSEAIKFPDNSFDAITVAFGVRNFANLKKGLEEMLRVLKPGGKAVILEFSKPKIRGVKQLYDLYTRIIAPEAGGMISGNKKAYKYLNDSIKAFPEGKRFLDIMQEAGYADCYKKTLSLGICTIYCGSKT